MSVLAFDTCLGACSVAVRARGAGGDWQLHDRYVEMPTGHAEALMPMIEAVMEQADCEFSALTRVAVTAGPGSFTGVRIGIAAARGFRLSLGIPVVTLTSFEVMAFRADMLLASGPLALSRAGRALAVCVDARNGQMFAQAFGTDVSEPLCEPMIGTPQMLLAAVQGRSVIAVGSAGAAFASAAREAGCEAVASLPGLLPHARHLAILSDAGRAAEAPAPLYLREHDARPPAAAPA